MSAWFADVSKIDSAAQTCSANLVLVMRWKDPRLSQSGGEARTYPRTQVWHPRWLLANEGDALRRSLPETVDVGPDGSAVYRQRLIGSFAQTLDLRRFPFDRARIRVILAILGTRPEEITLKPDPGFVAAGMPEAIGVAKSVTLQDWILSGLAAYSNPYELSPDYTVAGYVLEFTATRQAQHYVLKVIMPLLLIVMMSWMVFWIHPSAAAPQFSIAVTSMLTLIAYRFAVGTELPKLPYLTRLDAFILMSSILIFASLIEVVYTTQAAASGNLDHAKAVDQKCRWIFPLTFAFASLATFLR